MEDGLITTVFGGKLTSKYGYHSTLFPASHSRMTLKTPVTVE